MYGSFSETSIDAATALYDFTRCRRPDGSIYGSRGKCRKGTETVAEKEPEKIPKTRTPRLNKQEKIAIKVMADKSLRSDRKRVAEMVRLGVPKETDFVKLVSDAKAKIGLRAQDTVRGAGAKAKTKTQQPPKSLEERMAAAADKIDQKPSKPSPKKPETTTAAAKTARPVDPKVAAKVDKAVRAKKAGPAYTPEQLAAQDRLLTQSQAKAKAKGASSPEPGKRPRRSSEPEKQDGKPQGAQPAGKSKVPDERLKKSFDQALSTLDRLDRERKQLSREGVRWDDPRAKAVAEKMALAQSALTTIRQSYHALDRETFLRESSRALSSERQSRKLRAEAEREAKEKGLNVYTLPDDHPLKRKFIRANAIDEERRQDINSRVKSAFYGEPPTLTKAKSDGGGKVDSSVPSGLPRGGASKDLKDFLEGSAVVMAFPVSGFTKFVKEGEAKNGFERGTGGIKKGKGGYLDNRRGGEEKVLNIPEGADPKSRPVYAALEHPDRARSLQGGLYNQMAQYGGIQVVLSPSVKDRSTFTVGDSLDYAAPRDMKASPVRDPANPTVVDSGRSREATFNPGGGTNSNRMSIVANSYDIPTNPPYVETQIHGGLRLSDVQEVRVYRGHELPSATRKLLEKQGIRIVELPPQMGDLVHYSDSPGYRDITQLSQEA